MFPHLALTHWPFMVVPDRKYCDFIAGRRQLRADLQELLETQTRVDSSSIHLMWSWFGAGKTHTLYYFANKAEEATRSGSRNFLYPIYAEFPRSITSFLDVYRALMLSIDSELLTESFLELWTYPVHLERTKREIMATSPDLASGLHVIATGDERDQITAWRWLRGESLPLAELRRCGISRKISTSDEATRILVSVVRMLNTAAVCRGYQDSKVVLMLDEFQRIDRSSNRTILDVNTGLHSAFNACPTGLSLFISFSGTPRNDGLPQWFSPELVDRIGRTKVLVLPPLQPDEAMLFIKDVLAHFRIPQSKVPSSYYPFTEATCRKIVEETQRKDALRPRAIIQACHAVLQHADRKLEARELDIIQPDYAVRVLDEYVKVREVEE